jgi:hypothetical protein
MNAKDFATFVVLCAVLLPQSLHKADALFSKGGNP